MVPIHAAHEAAHFNERVTHEDSVFAERQALLEEKPEGLCLVSLVLTRRIVITSF
jgi:hypothetical protein